MTEVFTISDTHFSHNNILKFKQPDGSLVREFKSVEEMDTSLILNWNSVVKPDDIVIHCGDVCFSGQSYDRIMPLLHGKKYLVRGNHDTFSEGRYQRHFSRVLGCYVRDNYIFTHVPIHTECIGRFKANIHGHVHKDSLPDKRYVNVSVEVIGYTPINFRKIKEVAENDS